MSRLRDLTCLPFELAYLVLLTRSKLKPLSRWEAALTPSETDLLNGYGLEVAPVIRSTLFGRRLPRVVFSKSDRRIDEYKKRFDGKRLNDMPVVVREEGWFFGYPSCCVEQFIRKPYVVNNIPRADQRILFHWACPDCMSTRSLLREYTVIYRECVHMFGGCVPDHIASRCYARIPERSRALRLRRALPWVASLATLVLLPGFTGALDDDPHRLPAPDDVDGDGLSYAEEMVIGSALSLNDSDGNGIPDGVDEGLRLYSIIESLPTVPLPDGPYKVDWAMDGVEQCAVCGQWIGMGFFQIIHPVRGLETVVHKIALHYLEHGSIGYDGSIHSGRVDVDLLKRILTPVDAPHILVSALSDDDNDQLENGEEPLLLTDPLDPDTDGDSLEDGPQVVEGLVATLSMLPREPREDGPYVTENKLRGLETCDVCGETMNMGWITVINPLENISIDLPYIALHYLGHGGLGYSSDLHAGRTLPTVLSSVLYGTGGAHRIPIGNDSDNDGLTDDEELALGYEPYDEDTDHDGVPDGPDLSIFLSQIIETLPEGPLPDGRYVIHFQTYGMYQCLTCGEFINMGWMDIHDPSSGGCASLSYYNLHFMKHGSFSTDRPDLYGRKDPGELTSVLGISTGCEPHMPPVSVLTNAPNPFEASTVITLTLPEEQEITLSIFDAAGRKVCELLSGRTAESHTVTWDGKDADGYPVASGVYFCTMRTGSISLTRKMLKIR